MASHGVGTLEFAFDNGKRRLGCTHFVVTGSSSVAKKITLSRYYAALLSADEIRDVMLHEVAHALAGRGAGHGPAWKAIARKIGAKAQRCATPSASPEATVTGECPECLRTVAELHRLPQRVYACGVHRSSALTWKRRGVVVPVEDMPQKYRSDYSIMVDLEILK